MWVRTSSQTVLLTCCSKASNAFGDGNHNWLKSLSDFFFFPKAAAENNAACRNQGKTPNTAASEVVEGASFLNLRVI